MHPALTLLFSTALVAVQDTVRPTAAALVELARAFVPQYEGDHKAFLSADEERDARAAVNLLEAALALEPENTYALWWHGHCSVLLGENERNRGRAEVGREHYAAALNSFEATLASDPTYYWAAYSRAMAQRSLDRPWAAIEDFDRAVRLAEAVIESGAADDWAPFVRFKARQWRADTRLCIFEFERAREEFTDFYADNGNNQWDLGYSLAETYLRASDLAGARATYENVIADPEFAKFDSTYAELAYVAGLFGERDAALTRIRQALEREFQPTLYPRLWLWILADGEARDAARAGLEEFLRFPPDGLSAWDATLGRFLVGGSDVGAFLEEARLEEERRMAAGQALDDLPCEVWFYTGLWDERAGNESEALEAYRLALAFRPAKHKWEWAYARQHLAQVAARLGRAAEPGFRMDGGRILFEADRALNGAGGALAGQLESFSVHSAGSPRAQTRVALVEGDLRPGDLVRCIVQGEDGTRRALLVVVDAR